MKEMNFALKLRKIYLISIFAVLTASLLNAQQFSFENKNHIFSIIRYTFPNHLGIKKVYSISQNNLGIIFFSTNQGIISFDGQDWGAVNFGQKAFLAQSGGQLLVFSRNFTAELEKDASGLYSINQIKTRGNPKEWYPLDVAVAGDSVFLIAQGKLWLYRHNTFQELADSMGASYLFSQAGSAFVRSNSILFKIIHGELIALAQSGNSKDKVRSLNGNHNFSVLSRNNQLVLNCNQKGISHFVAPIADSIVTSYPDRSDNIWLASANALYCIKYAEYLQYLRYIPAFDGLQLAGIAKDSIGIYLASNNSVFYPSDKVLRFRENPLKGIYNLSGNILISNNAGIYLLKDEKATPLVSRSMSYVAQNRDKLIFVSKGFLYILRFINGAVSVKEIFNLKTDSVSKITVDESGNLFILTNNSKIFQLKPEKRGFVPVVLYQGGDITPALRDIFRIGSEIYVGNALNVYKLQGNNLINQDKTSLGFPGQGHFIEFLAEDTNGGILCSTAKPGEKKHIYYGKNESGHRLNWLEIPIWEAGLKNPSILINSGEEVVFFENGNLIHLDFPKFFAKADKLTLTTREVLIDGQPIGLQSKKIDKEVLPYFEVGYPVSLISLKFYASDLTNPGHVRYSFLMTDKDDEWSDWTSLPERNFSNLPPGEYKLLVKAQTLNGSISEPYALKFRILSPIYLHWYAWLFYAMVFLGLIGFIGIRRKRLYEKEKIKLEKIIHERTSELMREKEKTDELLANMLPKDTADELKNTGKATSHKFDMATVLFSDIQGFTKIAEQMNPEKLIDELDNFFFQFDSVVEKYNIEKIKTIGDAYMAAGGIPYKNRTNPVEVVLAAVEMQEYMKSLKQKNSDIWDLRIGVHTGAVIAGVIGHKRISYDIWGDTVNTASRMESSGEAGKINISGQTYELVKDFFICEYRGKMPVKYKGDIDMYFVKGIRPELSVNLRTIPNKKFFVQLQLTRILDLEEFVFDKLEAELSPNFPFHNLKHTKDVYTQAELLGRAENVTPEEMLLLRTTALLHDSGFIWAYHNHESKSIEFCREILPKFKYTAEQIDLVCELITFTRPNAKPQSRLEKIIVDANTDYFGRIDFLTMLQNLAKELKINYNRSEEDILLDQLNILQNHDYYTSTARKLREVPKEEQVKKLKEFIASGK